MDRLAHNLRCIEDGLAAVGFAPERRFPTGVQLYVSLEQAVVSIAAFSSEDGSWIVIYGTLPVRMPAERRTALAEAMTRVNYQQVIGNFELDSSDGELRYRIGHATDVDVLTSDLVERLVGYVLHVWGRFHQPLMQVAYGDASAEDAVRDALAAPGVGQVVDAPESGGASEPPNVDAILEEMGLTGPIGSLPGEQRTEDPAPLLSAHEVGKREIVRKLERQLGRMPGQVEETVTLPFPNGYVVPGTRLIAGEYPGDREHGAARRKVRQLLEAGVTRVFDLTRDGELVSYEKLLWEEAATRGIVVAYHRRPIRDVDICEPEQMRIILDEIDGALAAGETVYVHCWGGVGRTGTVVGCWLVRHGRNGDTALREVQALFESMSAAKVERHPEGSPQTPAQRRMVLEWGRMDSVERMSKSGQGD